MIARAIVQPNDTIVTLAARLTGDPRRYEQIITLNDLSPPYISSDGAPGTLAPGDEILYERVNATAPSPLEGQKLETLTYKRDLIASGGALVLAGAAPQSIAGLDNLRSALQRRLTTPLGAHPLHPTTYGSLIYQQLGTVADAARAEMIRADAIATVQRDPRVASASASVHWEANVARIRVTITPIEPGDPFDIDLSFRI